MGANWSFLSQAKVQEMFTSGTCQSALDSCGYLTDELFIRKRDSSLL